MRLHRILCAAAAACVIAGPLAALYDDYLTLDLWCELVPVRLEEGLERTLDPVEAQRTLLEEARLTISGMLYGYTYLYVPYDKVRGVAEQWEFTPIAEIPWGDPGLAIVSAKVDGARLVVRIKYTLQEHQRQRLNAWHTLGIPVETGTGQADTFKGPKERLTAVSQAVKNAVRNYARKRVVNKPREVTGTALLFEQPDISMRAGAYFAVAQVKVDIVKIQPYTAY